MVYLDYSANTPVNKDVLDTFCKVALNFSGNPNSLHSLGVKAKELIDASTRQIAEILNVKTEEIIYTSDSSEANNLAIKGICLKYQNRGKHIITTPFEHSSIYGPLNYLQTLGFDVDFVDMNEDGTVNLDSLKNLIREDTIMVTINAVNSEIGIRQPLDEIGEIIKENSKAFFHTDVTQAIGKIEVDLKNVDLASFTSHKFFGVNGIGCLIKKDKILLEPLIHGGKSTTIYRSGTPNVALIASLAKALRLAHENILEKYNYVLDLNKYLKESLKKYNNVYINSLDSCIPHILNFSVVGVKPETLVHALEQHEIYISTQSACSSNNAFSKSVLALTNSMDRAKSSVRISISPVTTKEELDEFLNIFDKCYKELVNE
ncbi:MAG: cysteine desulfurase [Firmicutes bacterium]|nr:cysteine desulfurase [Bacillota bacterium]